MSEKPILFSGAMVRAILADRKSQTRRIFKDSVSSDCVRFSSIDGIWRQMFKHGNGLLPKSWSHKCPYGQPGDRLWVRETFSPAFKPTATNSGCVYRADDDGLHLNPGAMDGLWKPSIFMPRRASRITLEITGVRVERVQDISEADAKSEGVEPMSHGFRDYLKRDVQFGDAKSSFESLWDSISSKRGFGWDTNPWTWVLEFQRTEAK